MSNIKHGKRKTRLYSIYSHMKQRCYNKNDQAYKYYGRIGITICNEWLNDFMTFYDWSMSNGYNDTLTIDRIDVNKSYSPDNCRWVDMKTQQRNKKNNRNITINGETHCLSEWCEILNVDYERTRQRICRDNWTIQKALELEEV